MSNLILFNFPKRIFSLQTTHSLDCQCASQARPIGTYVEREFQKCIAFIRTNNIIPFAYLNDTIYIRYFRLECLGLRHIGLPIRANVHVWVCLALLANKKILPSLSFTCSRSHPFDGTQSVITAYFTVASEFELRLKQACGVTSVCLAFYSAYLFIYWFIFVNIA